MQASLVSPSRQSVPLHLEDLPVLGIGINASAPEAPAVARAKSEGGAPEITGDSREIDSLGFLNIGVTTGFRRGSWTEPDPELPELLRHADLQCVVHVEEFNLTDELDEVWLDRLTKWCELLRPRWVQEDLGVWTWNGVALGSEMIPPIFDQVSLDVAVRNVVRIMRASGVPFLAENPPIDVALGDMDLLAFMDRLSQESGCGLLLDIGHLWGYCIHSGRDPFEYIEQARCMDRVIEVHIAGSDIVDTSRGRRWTDSHPLELDEDDLRILDAVLARAHNVRAITLEIDAAPADVVWGNVQKVRERSGSAVAR